jgi:hypothetical protein
MKELHPKSSTPMKFSAKLLVPLGAVALLFVLSPAAFGQVAMTDIGATDPTQGPNDISQLSIAGDTKFPDNLNYYIDNGANNGTYAGQTFTTGSDPHGYHLVSLSIKSAGIDHGGGYNTSQLFHLFIYSVSDGNSTVIKSYTATAVFTDGDWLRWTNLAVEMAPNTTYAYSFGRDASGSGWAGLGNTPGDTYSGGELAMLRGDGASIPFPITFGSSHAEDAAFIVGLTLSTANQLPQITTQPAAITAYTNAPVTFSVGLDLNAAVPSYQWRKGTSPIGGETNASLTITNAQFADAADYTVVVTNGFGAVTSSIATLTIVTGEPQVISFQLLPVAPWNTGNQPLADGDSIGAFPSANWNSGSVLLSDYGIYSTNTFVGLKDRSGVGSSVQLTVLGVSDAWRYNDPAPDSAPITKLLNSFCKTTNPGGANTLGNGLMQLVLTNLDNSKTYDVYVYLGGASDTHPDVDAGNGVTNYCGPEFDNLSSALVGSFNTDPNGTRNQANFVQLTNITPTAGAITVSVQYDPTLDASGGGDLGVSGLQIVESSLDAVAPTIQTQPVSATVYTNVPVTFSIAALGVPTPNLQWYQVVGGVTNLISGANGSSYTIDSATAAMNGAQFFVVASNPSGVTNSAAATLNVVTDSPTGIWSVQFDPLDTSAFRALASADRTGAFPATNWNPAAVVISGGDQSYPLKDSKGIGTAVQVIVSGCTDGWRLNDPPPDNAPITKLMNTFLKYGYGPNWPNYPNALGNGLMQLVLTNLDDSQTYDIYVYLEDDWVDSDYSAIDAGNGVSVYTGPAWSNVNQNSNFVESVSQDPNNPDQGNYVHLTGIAPTAGVITVSVNYHHPQGQQYGVGVCGIQILNSTVDLLPVSIFGQPLSQRVVTNTPATFTVKATGSPIAYQWYSIIGGTTNSIADATNRTYATGPVTDGMTGNGYFVVLSNSTSGSITSSVAVLTAGHTVAGHFLEADEYFQNYANGVTALGILYPTAAGLPAPNNIEFLGAFNDNADLPGSAGERIYGWFMPPVTGNYIFFEASDDTSTLWLSTNSSPSNVFQIAQNQDWMVAGNNGPTDWTLSNAGSGEYAYVTTGEWRSDQFELNGGPNAFANLISGWAPWPGLNGDGSITLVAGTPYYIELDHYQGGGGQGAAVTYKLAGNPDPATGDASLLTGNAISSQVPDSVVPRPRPKIASIGISASRVTLSGNNGLVNALYHVLTSTNASLPLSNWTVFGSARFDSNGNFSATNSVSGANQSYYVIQVP